ncbi:hypothetical protein BC834DRAFT_851966 [Gloeopeniophorella convolvens]|nr:hypothetical protein BC834DRAFT_851966 [Gloeopeniophorella convolvens]
MSEAQIVEYLNSLFQSTIYESIFSGILYGVYVISYFASTRILLSQGKALKSRPLLFMLSVTTIMFILGTIAFALSVCLSSQQFPQLLQLPAAWSTYYVDVTADIFAFITRLNPILSDIICAWRAVVLWNSDRRVLALLTTIVLGTIGAAGYDLSLALVTLSGKNSETDLNPHQGKVALIFVGPILGTNIVSTAFIAWKAWEHRRTVRTHLGEGSASERVEKILALLIESGAVYTLLWVLYLLTAFSVLPGSGSLIVNVVMLYVSSIYPTLITILVGLRRSQFERYATVSHEMQFERVPHPRERVLDIRRHGSTMLESMSEYDA